MNRYLRIFRIRRAGKRRLLVKLHYSISITRLAAVVKETGPKIGMSEQDINELINAADAALYRQMKRSLYGT